MAANRKVLFVIVTHFIFISSEECPSREALVPVVLVPGLGGSRLEAKLRKPEVMHSYCTRNTFDYFTLWLDIKQLLPLMVDCWVDNMKLNYDSAHHKTFNQPGVTTRVPDFGNPEMVEYLGSKSQEFIGGYMNHLVEDFIKLGYIRQKNLFAAPFDFRKGPSELTFYFDDLNQLIEDAYDYNNSSVIILSHSMGGQLVLNFLQNKTQTWKNKYIKGFISLSTPFGGSVKALKVFAAGDNLGVFLLRPQLLREMLSTMPSIAYLIPNRALWGEEVLVSTDEKNYSIDNLEEFFEDISLPEGWKMYQNEKQFASDLSPPGVELHCFYGSGIGTIKKLIYGSNSFPEKPMMEYENGDGTVNLRSLQHCQTWITGQQERVETKSFDGIDHMAIIQNKWALEYVMKTVKEFSNC